MDSIPSPVFERVAQGLVKVERRPPAGLARQLGRVGDERPRLRRPCVGPAWLNGRAITMSSPGCRAYCPLARSAAALLAAYGLAGRSGACSSTAPAASP